jgi:hypothetical protein
VLAGFFGIIAFTTKNNSSSAEHNYSVKKVERNAFSKSYQSFKNGALSNQLTDVGMGHKLHFFLIQILFKGGRESLLIVLTFNAM